MSDHKNAARSLIADAVETLYCNGEVRREVRALEDFISAAIADRDRLTAENRELREEVKLMHEHAERWRTACADADAELAREQAEVERLTEERDQAIGQRDAAMDDAERLRARDQQSMRDWQSLRADLAHVTEERDTVFSGAAVLALERSGARAMEDLLRADLAHERERVKVLKRLVHSAANRLESAADLLAGDDEEDDHDAYDFIERLRAALSPPGARCKHGIDLDRLRCMNCETGLEPAMPPGDANASKVTMACVKCNRPASAHCPSCGPLCTRHTEEWQCPICGRCCADGSPPPGDARVDDESRCAICGWTFDSEWRGCVRGNCSMRPPPERMYAPERAERERMRFPGDAKERP